MPAASVIVPWFYLLLPIAAVLVAWLRARWKKDSNPIRNMVVTSIAGAVGGLALVIIYMRGMKMHIPFSQIVITCYWGIGVATTLRLFSSLLAWAFGSGGGTDAKPCCAGATIASAIIRAAILLPVTVAYIGAMLLVYRPHAVNSQTPQSVLGVGYESVTFTATDGTRLSGWWIPAARTSRTHDENPPQEWGKRTVIFCHGFGADKASQINMIRDLVPNGYNVLAFDFRAHGESAGQLTTFGDLERRDVLGAVRWVQANHPAESKKIFGLGEGLGAAALIGAAADPGPEGQAIEAIAAFAPYDRLGALMQDVADALYVPKAGWLARYVALPVAGAQLGTRLTSFSPETEADKLAPRPLLVIATGKDHDIDISRSQEFYDRASQPKYACWIKKGGRRVMLFENDNVSMAVWLFFENARMIV